MLDQKKPIIVVRGDERVDCPCHSGSVEAGAIARIAPVSDGGPPQAARVEAEDTAAGRRARDPGGR